MKSNISNVPSSDQQVENVKAHPKPSPSHPSDPAQERIKTNNNCSIFLNSIKEYDENIFVCDFENQDFFWINKFNFETIV